MILTVLTTGTAAAETGQLMKTGPTAVIEKFNTRLLEAMKGGQEIGYTGRYTILESVVCEVFAFNLIVRISSGKYWQTMNTAQRQRLIELYQKWSTAVYARRYDCYNGQHFEVTPPEGPWGGRVDVKTCMIKENGDAVSFLYKLVKMEGEWKIVDIHVKGVSQLATTRAQFISVLKHDGFDGLEKVLLEKIKTSQSLK